MEQATLPLSRWRPSPARAIKLLAGLWLFGIGEALLVASRLGNSPWTVLAQGVAKHTPLSIGTATIVLSGLVLLMWIPLRQRPGLGTILNAILVGISIDVTLGLLPHGLPLAARLGEVVAGVCAVGVASGLYLTSYLGPGPRDGLMTGLHRVTGVSIRVVRACIELTALLVGFVLGGTVGIGTAAFALGIGPIVQEAIRIFGRGRPARHL